MTNLVPRSPTVRDLGTRLGNDVMVPFLSISSLRPGSALWEKGEKIDVGEKKKNWRANGKLMRRSFPLPRIPLSSLRLTIFFLFDPVFLAFSTTAEPDPRLSYLQIRWPQLYQVFVHGSIRWFQIVAKSQLHKCSCSGGRRGLWTATSWWKTDSKWCVRNFL